MDEEDVKIKVLGEFIAEIITGYYPENTKVIISENEIEIVQHEVIDLFKLEV